MTQTEKILRHLQDVGSISPLICQSKESINRYNAPLQSGRVFGGVVLQALHHTKNERGVSYG